MYDEWDPGLADSLFEGWVRQHLYYVKWYFMVAIDKKKKKKDS